MTYKVVACEDIAMCRWVSGVIKLGEHKTCCHATGKTEAEARQNAEVEYQKQQRVETVNKSIESNEATWTISTDDARIAGIGAFDKEQLASDIREQEKIMAGGVSLVPCESVLDEQVGFLDSVQIRNATISANSSACVVDGFGFGAAIHYLKAGSKVQRAGWNGKGMFIYYVPAASYPMQRNNLETMAGIFPDDMVPYREYLALKTAQNDVATWTPSVSDALATDWQIVV